MIKLSILGQYLDILRHNFFQILVSNETFQYRHFYGLSGMMSFVTFKIIDADFVVGNTPLLTLIFFDGNQCTINRLGSNQGNT